MCIQYQKKHVACMHPNNFEGSYSRYDSSKMLPTKGAPSAHDWRLRRLIKINFISTTTGGLPIFSGEGCEILKSKSSFPRWTFFVKMDP